MDKYKFKAYPSGDGEAFCFDVTAKEFQKVTGNFPHKKFNASYERKGYYSLYPNEFFKSDKLYEIEITVKEAQE